MTLSSRYQRGKLIAERGPIKTYQGLDPVTGLPVLIYRFPGEPRADASSLQSSRIPNILAVTTENDESTLVAAHGQDHHPLEAPVQPERVGALLLHTARALYDAAGNQVVHGDLRPERFYKGRHGYLLEGYGVPWDVRHSAYRAPEIGAEPSLAGDIYAWAKTIWLLTDGDLSDTVRKIVAACLRTEPSERPSAKQLVQTLRKHVTVEAAESASASDTRTSKKAKDTAKTQKVAPQEIDFNFDLGETSDDDLSETFGGGSIPPPSAPPQEDDFNFDLGANGGDGQGDTADEGSGQDTLSDTGGDALLLNTDPGTSAPPPPADAPRPTPPSSAAQRTPPSGAVQDDAGFVKDLPPGATYRAGNEPDETSKKMRVAPTQRPLGAPKPEPHNPERGRYLRRIALVAVLLLGGAALATLAFLQQDNGGSTATNGSTRYIVDVEVVPDSLRLVTLSVVSNPPGSERSPGDEIATVPGPVVLDEAGEWQLQARFQQRVSNIRTVVVPTQETIVFDLRIDAAE